MCYKRTCWDCIYWDYENGEFDSTVTEGMKRGMAKGECSPNAFIIAPCRFAAPGMIVGGEINRPKTCGASRCGSGAEDFYALYHGSRNVWSHFLLDTLMQITDEERTAKEK